MKSIHVRNLSPVVLDALKRLAERHHRSLQGELHFILENAAKLAPPEEALGKLKLLTVNTGEEGTIGREEMYGDDGR